MSSNYIAEKGGWKLTRFTLLLTSDSQIAYFLCAFGTVMDVISRIGLVRALYMPDKPNLHILLGKRKDILIYFIGNSLMRDAQIGIQVRHQVLQNTSSFAPFTIASISSAISSEDSLM